MAKGYVSITNTVESTRVIVDTGNPDFVAIRFYNGNDVVATCYASCPDGKEYVMLSPIDFRDQTILMEAEDAESNTAE